MAGWQKPIQHRKAIILQFEKKKEKSDRERHMTPHGITHMYNLILKDDTNELIYKTEKGSQIMKTNLRLQRGDMGGKREKTGAVPPSPCACFSTGC